MRGADTFTESLFTMRHLEDFVPSDHPLRAIRQMVNEALVKMQVLFARMYEADIKGGRPRRLAGSGLAFMQNNVPQATCVDTWHGKDPQRPGSLMCREAVADTKHWRPESPNLDEPAD